MFGFERRWALSIMEAMAPSSGDPPAQPELLTAAPGEADFQHALGRVYGRATPLARISMRLSIWLVTWAPLWVGLGAFSFGSLTLERRQELLERLLDHQLFAVREAAFMLKVCASLAILGAPGVRARSGYDGNTPERDSRQGTR